MLAKERLRGLWRGLVPSVTRTVPGVGIYFSSMHWMRSQLGGRKPSTTQVIFIVIIIMVRFTSHDPKALLIGASARAVAAFTMIPFTVLKTR